MIVILSLIICGLIINPVYGVNSSNSNLTKGDRNMDLVEKDWRSEFEKKADEEYMKSGKALYKPDIIATYGKLPEFKTEEQRRYWLDKVLPAIKHDLDNKIVNQYFYPAGPLVMFGYGPDGFTATVLENVTIDKPLMDEIYGVIDEEAKKLDVQEVPVRFILGDFAQPVLEVEEPLSNETSNKSVIGFGLLGGLTVLLVGWLFRRKVKRPLVKHEEK